MIPSTYDKAQELNLDPAVYGTFAEIGAGQETANWFFRAPGPQDRRQDDFRLRHDNERRHLWPARATFPRAAHGDARS